MIFRQEWGSVNIFKLSYKIVRDNSNDIYKGFGFKHLSDVTQYYVHPDNQSFKGTTTLCQPIGESVILFASMLSDIMNGNVYGDYYTSDDRETVFFEIEVPEDYHENGVVEKEVHKYRALYHDDEIKVASYDHNDRWIDCSIDSLKRLYKLLPCFCVILAREMETNPDFRALMEHFIENPTADVFVNLHEDFYQNHKMDDLEIEYTDISYIDTSEMLSFSSSYEVIRENKNQMRDQKAIEITPFPPGAFSPEQLAFLPSLPPEFVLPKNLYSVCNAVARGDILSILLHGPAGTGKTMSCKLICQAIGLPIMKPSTARKI